MATQDNCGEFVTEQYIRVFAPDGEFSVHACPNCPDLTRSGADIRETKC